MESFIPIPHLYDIWGNKNLVRRVEDRFNCSFVVKNDSKLIITAIESANRTNNKTFFIKTISKDIIK
jgi:predicted NBD/HSP70 family sugar kinase